MNDFMIELLINSPKIQMGAKKARDCIVSKKKLEKALPTLPSECIEKIYANAEKLSEQQKALYYFTLIAGRYGAIGQRSYDEDDPEMFQLNAIEECLKNYPEVTWVVFYDSVLSVLQPTLEKQFPYDEKGGAQWYTDSIQYLRSKIPSNYRRDISHNANEMLKHCLCFNTASQPWHIVLSNTMSVGKIARQGSFAKRAKAAMKIIECVLSPEEIKTLKKKHDEIAVIFADCVKEYLLKNRLMIGSRSTIPSQNSPAIDDNPYRAKYLGEADVELFQTSPEEAVRCYDFSSCAILSGVLFKSMNEKTKERHISLSDLCFSLLYGASRYNSDANLSGVMQFLYRYVSIIYMTDYESWEERDEKRVKVIFGEENEEGRMVFDATNCFPRRKKTGYNFAPELKPYSDGISLFTFMSTVAGSRQNDTIEISTKWKPYFMEVYGLSSDEAIALCGYLSGSIREWYFDGMLMECLTETLDKEDREFLRATDEGNDIEEITKVIETTVAQNRELEAQLKGATAEIERLNNALTRSERDKRRAEYDLQQIQKSIVKEDDDQSRQIAKLNEQIKRLEEAILNISSATNADNEQVQDAGGETLSVGSQEWQDACHRVGEDKSVVIVGGDEQWVAKMRNTFPNVKFNTDGDVPNDDTLKWADIVFINTFEVSHKSFYRINAFCKNVAFFPTRGYKSCANFLLNHFLHQESANFEG